MFNNVKNVLEIRNILLKLVIEMFSKLLQKRLLNLLSFEYELINTQIY